MTGAQIYLRRNGSFGARCDGVEDTGHHINEDSGKFTVVSIHNEADFICEDATREEAELAITKDWRLD